MTSPKLPTDELLRDLFDAACSGVISDEQFDRLEAVLAASEEARRLYLRYCSLEGDLYFLVSMNHAEEATSVWRREKPDIGLGELQSLGIRAPHPAPLVPPIIIDSTAAGPFIFGRLLSSYGIAAAVMCLLLLILGMRNISFRDQIDGTSQSTALTTPAGQATEFVGRITGLVDCHWADQASAPSERDRVPLKQKYALVSGFMEISYDTGAKVILQGPCRYEVDSAQSGLLSLGKLCARVDSGSRGERTANQLFRPEMAPTTSLALRPLEPAQSGDWRVENGEKSASHGSAPRHSTSNSGLFAIRTPLAVVTDFGTEFGVEVDTSGATRTCVFQGKVKFRRIDAPARDPEGDASVLLTANQSVSIEPAHPQGLKVLRQTPPATAAVFVRQMPVYRYRFTDLGTFGGAESRPCAINAVGQIVGMAFDRNGLGRAFLHADGKLNDLGIFPVANSWANDINAFGHVVGAGGVGQMAGFTMKAPKGTLEQVGAVYFDGHSTKNLGTLGGQSACAFGINNAGQVVGYSKDARGVERAFIYSSAVGMKPLGPLDDSRVASQARAINASGQVVGQFNAVAGGPIRAFLYTPGAGLKDLGRLGGKIGVAIHLNDMGQVVGYSTTTPDQSPWHAFFYSDRTGLKDLGTLGGRNSRAFRINNRGQIVGGADCLDHGRVRHHAFLYSGGKMLDLNALTSAAGWTLEAATAINDSGSIVGYGAAPGGATRAFLLTPIGRNQEKNAL